MEVAQQNKDIVDPPPPAAASRPIRTNVPVCALAKAAKPHLLSVLADYDVAVVLQAWGIKQHFCVAWTTLHRRKDESSQSRYKSFSERLQAQGAILHVSLHCYREMSLGRRKKVGKNFGLLTSTNEKQNEEKRRRSSCSLRQHQNLRVEYFSWSHSSESIGEVEESLSVCYCFSGGWFYLFIQSLVIA